ncbi:hypothetical protein Q5P01_012215 [Channa striata]|uniref:Uncharacterized protein n=1 Tax=Channa striata TaxID=64152 RepID=A0AA88MPB2_CHASR|nr:hypothetical protein Q5P01_012215 [Channa striata]
MRIQQAGTANNCQYMKANSGVRQPQSAHPNFSDGGNRSMTNCQTSAAPHQRLSFQQPAGHDSNFYLRSLLQSSSPVHQTGNPGVMVTDGFQGPTQHNFCHNSAPNSSPPSPPRLMMPNSTYPHQDMPPYCNRLVHRNQSTWTQDSNFGSDLQHYRVQNPPHQNVNRELMQPISAYTTTAPSLVSKQDTSTMMSATSSNRQAVPIPIHRQNSPQHGLPPSSPPCYNTAVRQLCRNDSYTAKSLSSEQILHASSLNQKKQYASQINTTQNIRQETSNSYRNQYEINNFVSKGNSVPFNPTAGTQQKMPTVGRTVDSLQRSDTAGSDGRRLLHPSSSSRGKQVVSEVKMTESNQTLQPVTATKGHINNSNIYQLLLLFSEKYLSKTTQKVASRTQHFANVPPQQNSAADSLNVTATVDGRGNGNQAHSTLSKKSLPGSNDSNDLSQLQLFENTSPQKDKPQLSAAKSNEMLETLETLSPDKQSDSSVHSSPGHPGARAVAIVQPLSQKYYLATSRGSSFNAINEWNKCSTADESQSNPDKVCISPVAKKQAVHLRDGFNLSTENANQMRPNGLPVNRSATSNDDALSSSSAGPQDLWQKGADDTRSELAINMPADPPVDTAGQQSVSSELLGSQHSNMDKRETPTELSSLPTTPWTTVMLSNLIMDEEKAQKELKDFTQPDPASKILNMFWNGNCKMLSDSLKTGWYKDLIADVMECCHKQADDSVVLLQVKHTFGELIKSYHVLSHNEVYSEPTYKSSWLNVNEQLDDIDKEFGFPWSLKHRLIVLENDSEPDQDRRISSSIPAEIETEVPKKVLSKTELEPVDSDKKKHSPSAESVLPQASSPSKTDCVDFSDPYYAFKIQVLPPEEAKMIFKQIEGTMAQSVDVDSGQSEEVVNSPTEGELHEVKDVTLKESKQEDESVSAIKQICCLSKWLEIIAGSNGPLINKCQCKEEQSLKDSTEKTLVKDETIAEKSLIRFDPKFHSPVKGENQGNNGDNQASSGEKNPIITVRFPEFSDGHTKTIDLNEDNKPHIYFDKETTDILHISINDSESSIILISEDEAEANSSSENEFAKQMPAPGIMIKDPEEECAQDQLKSAVNRPSNDSENSKCTEIANQISDPEEHCAQAQQTSTNVTASSPEPPEEKHKARKRKRKRLGSKGGILPFVHITKKCKHAVDRDSQPVFKGVKCKKDFVDAPETKPLATNGRTVELMLFGSACQDKCAVTDRSRQISSPKSTAPPLPPEVLTMHLSPLKRTGHAPAGPHSAKERIREKWRSLPPAQIRQRGKWRTQKCPFASISGASFRKPETVSTNTMEPQVSSEMRMWNKNRKHSLSLKRRSPSNEGKRRNKKMKVAATLKQSDDQVRSECDNGSQAGIPQKENSVLRFNVLPNTFNFKYGSSEMKEITDPVSDIPDHAKNQDKYPRKTNRRQTGITWYPDSEKYCPLPSPPVPKMAGLFQEFQKKYMQKAQTNK